MRGGSADIRSPDVLRRFHHRYIEFDKRARSALDLVSGDVRSVGVWLQREQLPYWRAQLRRRHDEMKQAWRDYVNARYGDRRMGKPSSIDERKIWERAKRRREQAEEKITIVENWLVVLERDAEKLMPPCRRFETLLDDLSPKALARLDHMMDRLDEYMRPTSTRSASAGPVAPRLDGPGKKEGNDA